jgi:hypothetical protein
MPYEFFTTAKSAPFYAPFLVTFFYANFKSAKALSEGSFFFGLGTLLINAFYAILDSSTIPTPGYALISLAETI